MIDLKAICRKLESKSCPQHLERPIAKVVRDKIDLTCCCEKFQKELEKQIDVEVMAQMNKGIDDLFK